MDGTVDQRQQELARACIGADHASTDLAYATALRRRVRVAYCLDSFSIGGTELNAVSASVFPSKSLGAPPFQTRKVLVLSNLSGVTSPTPRWDYRGGERAGERQGTGSRAWWHR
jgi:hypothetical protein